MRVYFQNKKIGSTLIFTLFSISIFLTLSMAALNWVLMQNKASLHSQIRERSFNIAEAGANYYRWHLAHAPKDFQDGTGGPGPYVHDYYDSYGNLIGKFELEITPPPIGSTITTIKSTGYLISSPNSKRVITTKQGTPSLTQFAVLADDNMRFGEDTEVFGRIHANGGIRFDGIAHNLVTSNKGTYTDPDTGLTKPGVWTSKSNPSQVFLAGTQFPVSRIDFGQVSGTLDTIRTAADANGIYLTPSGNRGYYIHLRNDQKLDIYKVTAVSSKCDGKATDRIDNKTSFTYKGKSSIGLDMPTNGLIFSDDKIWVDGQINNNRLTIGVGFSVTNPNDIIVNNDLTYTHYDGTDSIGLIAQNNISTGLYSEDNLTIDGALFAQNGRVGRDYFPSSCSGAYYKRDVITLRGALGSSKRYGFSWICCDWAGNCSWCSGYHYRNLNFDENLVYAPPPSFPTTATSTIISWEEQ